DLRVFLMSHGNFFRQVRIIDCFASLNLSLLQLRKDGRQSHSVDTSTFYRNHILYMRFPKLFLLVLCLFISLYTTACSPDEAALPDAQEFVAFCMESLNAAEPDAVTREECECMESKLRKNLTAEQYRRFVPGTSTESDR